LERYVQPRLTRHADLELVGKDGNGLVEFLHENGPLLVRRPFPNLLSPESYKGVRLGVPPGQVPGGGQLAVYGPLDTEYFFRRLFGQSAHHMGGALQTDRVWRDHVARAIQHPVRLEDDRVLIGDRLVGVGVRQTETAVLEDRRPDHGRRPRPQQGRGAPVLGLDEMLITAQSEGAYGIKDGAESLPPVS
jgi:hypothetical protein